MKTLSRITIKSFELTPEGALTLFTNYHMWRILLLYGSDILSDVTVGHPPIKASASDLQAPIIIFESRQESSVTY